MAKAAAQMVREAEEREELALQAKQHLVSQYLHLGSCMKRCSSAIEDFSHALNDAVSVEEIRELLKPPLAGPVPGGLPTEFPFLSISKTIKKRNKSEETDEEGLDDDGKKKKRKSRKADKDPNAPKRPMSAYLMFQNAVRQEMKEKNPDTPYKELILQVGEAWKQLGDNGQKPYKDAADNLMATWKTDSASYVANKDGSMILDPDDAMDAAIVENIMVAKEIKKEKKVSKEAAESKEDAPKKKSKGNPLSTTTTTTMATPPDLPLASKTKKPSKKAIGSIAPSSKAAPTSTPAVSKGATQVAKPVLSKKPAQPDSSSDSTGDDDEEDSSSDDE